MTHSRVLIEARPLSASMGVRTYVLKLLEELLKDDPQQYTIVYDRNQHRGTFPQAHEVVLPLRHELLLSWWFNQQVPKLLQELKPNVVHFTKQMVPRKITCPTVVTIHDVIPLLLPQSQLFLKRLFWPQALRHAASSSHHIITVSEASKADIIQHLHVPPEKITVTLQATDLAHFRPADEAAKQAIRQKHQLSGPFILFVGTWEPRKNIPALVRAYAKIAAKIPHRLVITGKRGWKYEEIEQALKTTPAADRITVLPPVDYQDLPILMSAADFLVWPSVYEGWGHPPLEAMACGTPVIVSNGGALPEVVGDAGEIVPFSAGAILERLHDDTFEQLLADHMERLALDTPYRQSLAAKSRARAEQFSWQRLAEQTRRVYERVAGF